MTSTKVETRDNRELRRVEALDGDGEVAGFAEYQISVDGNTFDFTHFEVDERFADKGVGSSLAAGVMDFAREAGIKIVPTCPFLRHHMEKHEDTHDLLADDVTLGEDDETGEAEEASDSDDSDDSDDSEDSAADVDSPDAGPADAKAAGSGGASDEEASRS